MIYFGKELMNLDAWSGCLNKGVMTMHLGRGLTPLDMGRRCLRKGDIFGKGLDDCRCGEEMPRAECDDGTFWKRVGDCRCREKMLNGGGHDCRWGRGFPLGSELYLYKRGGCFYRKNMLSICVCGGFGQDIIAQIG